MTYRQLWWPILGICALSINSSKLHTHTPGTVGRHLCSGALGDSVHLSRGIENGESAVHSLPPPTIPACLVLGHDVPKLYCIYNLFQEILLFRTFYSWNNLVFYFHKILSSTTVFKIDNTNIYIYIEQQISILPWFLKDHVTLKSGVTMLKIQLYHNRNKLPFKMYYTTKQLF